MNGTGEEITLPSFSWGKIGQTAFDWLSCFVFFYCLSGFAFKKARWDVYSVQFRYYRNCSLFIPIFHYEAPIRAV